MGAAGGRGERARLAASYDRDAVHDEQPRLADIDRDGDVDLVLAEHRGDRRIAVWENDGRGAFRERRVGRGVESHLGARLADLDGDGDLDLVSIAYDDFAGLHLWRNSAIPPREAERRR